MLDVKYSTSQDIDQIINENGLHFLIEARDLSVICNGVTYTMPTMARALKKATGSASIVCSFLTQKQAHQALAKVIRDGALQPGQITGMRKVHRSSPSHVRLSGGSYATTLASLDNKNKHWKVIKKCYRYNHPDKDLRLSAEIESVLSLPPKAQKLFPAMLRRDSNDHEVLYELEYVPYHNFAEVAQASWLEKEQLANLLIHIYDRLFDDLYLPKQHEPAFIPITHYSKTIPRRLFDIKNAPHASNELIAYMSARTIEINGKLYPGLNETMQMAEAFLHDKRIPNTHNHGDLILQDILVDPATYDFRLIDGNGHSKSYIYDMSKTLLCLETNYDLYYNGDFSLLSKIGEIPRAELVFQNDSHVATLEELRSAFWKYLENNQQIFFPNMPEWRKTLLTICGLQNIAIVMFHSLHHQKHDRASGFLLSGIKLINDNL